MKKRGFTLIELLVVIAIIALLLSILVPSLAKVKEQAKKLVCQTRIRSLSMCVFLYAGDYDDKTPPDVTVRDNANPWNGISSANWLGDVTDPPYFWDYKISPYLGLDPGEYGPYHKEEWGWGYDVPKSAVSEGWEAFVCPKYTMATYTEAEYEAGTLPGFRLQTERNTSTYRYNRGARAVSGRLGGKSVPERRRGRVMEKTSKIGRPSDTIVLIDGKSGIYNSGIGYYFDDLGHFTSSHNDGLTIGFYDGHMGFIPDVPEDFLDRERNYPNWELPSGIRM